MIYIIKIYIEDNFIIFETFDEIHFFQINFTSNQQDILTLQYNYAKDYKKTSKISKNTFIDNSSISFIYEGNFPKNKVTDLLKRLINKNQMTNFSLLSKTRNSEMFVFANKRKIYVLNELETPFILKNKNGNFTIDISLVSEDNLILEYQINLSKTLQMSKNAFNSDEVIFKDNEEKTINMEYDESKKLFRLKKSVNEIIPEKNIEDFNIDVFM